MYINTVTRPAIIQELIERDGYRCTYPGCTEPFDETPNAPHSITIDHIYPQALARSQGWTEEEIHHISNLQLQGKACNAKKSDRLYDVDGVLEIRHQIKIPKSQRPDQCETCGSGRLLLIGEMCDVCGSGPQPTTAPRSLKRPVKECDHDIYHCWMCYLDLIPRKSVISSILTSGEVE